MLFCRVARQRDSRRQGVRTPLDPAPIWIPVCDHGRKGEAVAECPDGKDLPPPQNLPVLPGV